MAASQIGHLTKQTYIPLCVNHGNKIITQYSIGLERLMNPYLGLNFGHVPQFKSGYSNQVTFAVDIVNIHWLILWLDQILQINRMVISQCTRYSQNSTGPTTCSSDSTMSSLSTVLSMGKDRISLFLYRSYNIFRVASPFSKERQLPISMSQDNIKNFISSREQSLLLLIRSTIICIGYSYIQLTAFLLSTVRLTGYGNSLLCLSTAV